jgi:hypothetical protein
MVFQTSDEAAEAHAKLLSEQRGAGQAGLTVPPLPPPGMETRQLRLHLCHLVSPQKFWVSSVERGADLERLHRLLAEASRSGLRTPVKVVPGQVYLAPYQRDQREHLEEVVMYR